MNADKSQSRQFSHPQTVSTETHDKAVNINIEDVKKLHKTKENFEEFYAIFNCIGIENDFILMNFALKEKFCKVRNQYKDCNIQLARLITEFGGNNKNGHNILKDFDFNRFILKTQHYDAKEALINASDRGHHVVVKLLLTVPGIDVNAKNEYGFTALIRASICGCHKVVELLITYPGIDISAKDNDNKTALIRASENGCHEFVKLFLTVPG